MSENDDHCNLCGEDIDWEDGRHDLVDEWIVWCHAERRGFDIAAMGTFSDAV